MSFVRLRPITSSATSLVWFNRGRAGVVWQLQITVHAVGEAGSARSAARAALSCVWRQSHVRVLFVCLRFCVRRGSGAVGEGLGCRVEAPATRHGGGAQLEVSVGGAVSMVNLTNGASTPVAACAAAYTAVSMTGSFSYTNMALGGSMFGAASLYDGAATAYVGNRESVVTLYGASGACVFVFL